MPIRFATSTSTETALTTGETLNLTCLGDNRLLVVGIGIRDGGSTTVSDVIYDGATLTALRTDEYTEVVTSHLYYLIAPSANTAAALSVNVSAVKQIMFGAMAFYGVLQTTTAIVEHDGANGLSKRMAVTLTGTAAGQFTPNVVMYADNPGLVQFTIEDGGSEQWDVQVSGSDKSSFGGGYYSTSGIDTDRDVKWRDTTGGGSGGGSAWAMSAMMLAPYVGPAGTHTVNQMLTRDIVEGFRRLEIKRRLDDGSGNYEANWLDITDDVKAWGRIKWSLDDEQYATFKQSGLNITCRNDSGQFDAPGNAASYWNGYLTRYKTLIRLQAGFLSPTDRTEIPPLGQFNSDSTSTQFIGVLSEPIELGDPNEAALRAKPLHSVLEDLEANRLVVASAGANGQLVASDYLHRMKDVTDGSGNFVLRTFITQTDWSIDGTTNTMSSLNTTTELDNYNCWSLAVKLAEASGFAVWVDKMGVLHFEDNAAAADVSFVLSGIPHMNRTYGHTIKRIVSHQRDLDNLYTRVRIKFDEDDTSTSWVEQAEAWDTSDSSASWKYGVRTLKIENTWMDATVAGNIASALFNELSVPLDRVEIECKFLPLMNLLDRIQIDYDTQTGGGTLWDLFTWDNANWDLELGSTYFFTGKDFRVIGLMQDLDKMSTKLTVRDIP